LTYSEVLAREYGDKRLFDRVHRLTVDSYAVQHTGRPSAQSIQSVARHLISLCALLEHGASADWATKLIGESGSIKARFIWLQPPASLGSLTIVEIWQAKGPAEHERKVTEWASSAWAAWSAHHATVRLWHSSIQGVGPMTGRSADATLARGTLDAGRPPNPTRGHREEAG
jgi:hypothetical protein